LIAKNFIFLIVLIAKNFIFLIADEKGNRLF